MDRLNPRDVAAYGQRRMKFQKKHVKLLQTLAEEGHVLLPFLSFTPSHLLFFDSNIDRISRSRKMEHLTPLEVFLNLYFSFQTGISRNFR